MKNRNPQGFRFPKYLAFTQENLSFTLMKTVDVTEAIAEGADRLQRYITPDRFDAWKKVVWWRRRKVTKSYTATSRLPLKVKKVVDTLTPFVHTKLTENAIFTSKTEEKHNGLMRDPCFVVSLETPRNCDVKKNRRIEEEIADIRSSVKTVVEQFALNLGERLEEFLFTLLRGVDGNWYFLNCHRCKTEEIDAIITGKSTTRLRPSHLSLEELTERIHNQRKVTELPVLKLPEINVHVPVTKELLIEGKIAKSLPTTSQHVRYFSQDRVVGHVDAVATRMDHLRSQSQLLKQTFQASKTSKLASFSSPQLTHIIHSLYDSILQDSSLSKYFQNPDRVRTQVSAAVKQVLIQGSSHAIIRKTHQHLGITDSDFDLYVGHFMQALEREGVRKDEEVTLTKATLETFRRDVVAKKGL